MTGAPGPADAEKAMADARAHFDDAAQSADPAVQRDRYKQAAQRLGYAKRILDALATSPPGEGGVPLSFVGARVPSSAPVFTP